MRLSLFPTILAFLALVALADRATAACSLAKLAEVPVTMSGLRPLIPARIDGHDGMFVADSGAFFNTLAPASVAKFGLTERPAPMDVILGGFGGQETQVSLATAKDFTFADIPFHKVDFLVLAKGLGDGEDGLIGQNLFSNFDVEYDLANGVMRLFIPTGCENAPLAYWAGSQPFSTLDFTAAHYTRANATAYARLNGLIIHVEFDTGSPVSILSLDAAAKAGVKTQDTGVAVANQLGGIARRSDIPTWIAPFASFKLGDEEIRNTRLRIGEIGLEDQGVQMLIGADFFLSHRVFVSNSQHKIYFTYNGGPVFNLDSKATTASATQAPGGETKADSDAPTDADGFARRAAAFESRRAFDLAIADLTQAIKLAPTEPKYLLQRGAAEWSIGHVDLAQADFDQALKLKPDAVPALLARSALHHARKETAEALADLRSADHAAASDPDARLAIAAAYEGEGLHRESIGQLDQWIAAHPKDEKLAGALNNRCWSRALLGQELDQALADCDAALKLDPGDPNIVDSRGLVRLRLGDFDQSIADYQAALRVMPNSAWTLYGRGLARLKKGLTADGDADLKAATALQPSLPDEAKAAGLTP